MEIINYKLTDLSLEKIKEFYGNNDFNLKFLENRFKVFISGNGDNITINCNKEDKDKILNALNKLLDLVKKDKEINSMVLDSIIKNENIDNSIRFVVTYNSKVISPKTKSQEQYYKLLENNTIIFAMGSAGTGKTYLGVAYGIDMLKKKKVNKIVITRPIVEAGENLGFLPGELKEKVDPYLAPIYDAFYDILGKEMTEKYIEKGVVEIAPLAYMRGRTLQDAFVLLDEAQNTTSSQMKMFLTRLGYNSKMVITGDESQVDLKPNIKSGIVIASEILKGIEDIGVIRFSNDDVVRNPLVSKIIKAYESYEK